MSVPVVATADIRRRWSASMAPLCSNMRAADRRSHHSPRTAPVLPLTGKWPLAYARAMADVFAALADATRRAILDELTERDGQTLFELCARLAMRHGLTSSRQAISQHLAVLESAGLVRTRREGRYKFHFVDTRPLKGIAERWPIKE